MVKRMAAFSPLVRPPSTVMSSTTRSEGGGSSISTGVAEARRLLFSLVDSNTLPRGSMLLRGTSVCTKM